ncbi:hypothetical protein ACODME_004019 [Escherichia coli]
MNMKKTLIALAVAASAAVSGSAMAWKEGGTGNSVNIGGSLTPVEKVNPWEVKTGDAVTGLDAQIKKGQNVVDITVEQAIPVLGIRSKTETFNGRAGIKPQIDYRGVVNFTGSKGMAPVTLEVFDNSSKRIGSLQTTLTGIAVYSTSGGGETPNYGGLGASTSNDSFFGGVGGVSSVPNYSDSVAILNGISNEYLEKYTKQSNGVERPGSMLFGNPAISYSAAYGSGITKGQVIKITLDQGAAGDAPIAWKASLPVTVRYQ